MAKNKFKSKEFTVKAALKPFTKKESNSIIVRGRRYYVSNSGDPREFGMFDGLLRPYM